MRNGHVAMRGQVLLTKSPKSVWEREKEREGGQRRERDLFRERSSTFSLKIPGDRTVGFRRDKEQSCSPWQGLHVGTSFGEFLQTPGKVGVFLLLVLFFA